MAACFLGEAVQGLILTPVLTLGLHSGGEVPLPFPTLAFTLFEILLLYV